MEKDLQRYKDPEKRKQYLKNWKLTHPNYQKDYYQKHKEESRLSSKKWKEQNPEKVKLIQKKCAKKNGYKYQKLDCQKKRLIVLTHYGGTPPKCACCGETELDFLTIDHINGGGNKHRRQLFGHAVGGYHFYYWLIKNNFPEGYRVLCWNCNWGCRKNNGVCSHVIHSKC